jgi:hypothetical protein
MIGRLRGLRGKLSSHWLASALAAGYLVLSIVLGVALLTAPVYTTGATAPVASTPTSTFEDLPPDPTTETGGGVDSSGAAATTVPRPSARPPTTTTRHPPATLPAPAGYQRVSGPAGLRTVIPAGWRAARSTGPGAVQANDPADAEHYVKYGGSAAPTLAIETSHVQYENDFAARSANYRRIKLRSASYGGHDAVEWEFEQREGVSVKHVSSLYWRADGKEYFILAAAPTGEWQHMRPVYDAMVANATP